jgi:hypothetical protein
MKDEQGRNMARLGDTTDHGGKVIQAAPDFSHTVTDSLGAAHTGVLDAAGRALVTGLAAGATSVKLGRDPHDPWASGSYHNPPAWKPTDATASASA